MKPIGNIFFIIIKVLVFLLMSWLIVDQLFLKNNFNTLWDLFIKNISWQTFYLVVAVIFLMPVNWLLETVKWKVLLKNDAVPFTSLIKGVFAGLTFGFVTPGRWGEFIGRILFMGNGDGMGNRAKIFYLSSIGGMAQTAVTLMAGALFISFVKPDIFLQAVVTGLAFAFALLYFRFDWLNRIIVAIPFLRNRQLIIEHQDLPDISVQLKVLSLAFLRFVVYVSQYLLIFSFFGLGQNAFVVLTHCIAFLLMQTFSPLMPLLDISYRGGTALWVFSPITTNQLAVLSSITFIWALNLAIPAIAGYFFILRKQNAR